MSRRQYLSWLTVALAGGPALLASDPAAAAGRKRHLARPKMRPLDLALKVDRDAMNIEPAAGDRSNRDNAELLPDEEFEPRAGPSVEVVRAPRREGRDTDSADESDGLLDDLRLREIMIRMTTRF